MNFTLLQTSVSDSLINSLFVRHINSIKKHFPMHYGQSCHITSLVKQPGLVCDVTLVTWIVKSVSTDHVNRAPIFILIESRGPTVFASLVGWAWQTLPLSLVSSRTRKTKPMINRNQAPCSYFCPCLRLSVQVVQTINQIPSSRSNKTSWQGDSEQLPRAALVLLVQVQTS